MIGQIVIIKWVLSKFTYEYGKMNVPEFDPEWKSVASHNNHVVFCVNTFTQLPRCDQQNNHNYCSISKHKLHNRKLWW